LLASLFPRALDISVGLSPNARARAQVYAAGFSFLLLDERLGAQGLAGGALLVAAAVLNLKIQSDEEMPTGAE
jgi:drug/metabolite transporter (DMT)-like permease